MTIVFAMMSVSLDGYVSGHNGGPGLGLDVDEPILLGTTRVISRAGSTRTTGSRWIDRTFLSSILPAPEQAPWSAGVGPMRHQVVGVVRARIRLHRCS